MAVSIQEAIEKGVRQLSDSRILSSELDTYLLLGHCLKKSRTQILLDVKKYLTEEEYTTFSEYLSRRSQHEPVAYIVGEREFWSLPFYVNKDVLIPRPETEFLLELVVKEVTEQKVPFTNCLDLCCGSGVIAVVLAIELGFPVYAVDLSLKALDVTRKNAKRHGVEEKVEVVHSHLYSELDEGEIFSLIVSNPPYVSTIDIQQNIDREVKEYEPLLALEGGEDGLNLIREIAHATLHHIAPGGLFFMEFGADQGKSILEIFSQQTYRDRHYASLSIHKDYSGRDRVLSAKVNHYKEN